jgi:hypothetical protein
MAMSRAYRGLSEAQSNAEALARRATPYTVASDASIRVAWDFRKREPANLREAEHYVRRAWADEVPDRLHKGPDNAEGLYGAPGMTPQAEGYIFGPASSSDARRDPVTGEWDAMSYFNAPFRAALANLSHGVEAERKRGAIVGHVAMGQHAREAAIREGVPSWCAGIVAEDALRSFLRNLSDVRIDMRRQAEAVA